MFDTSSSYCCPYCHRPNTAVVDSRYRGKRQYRRRKCKCGQVFATYEITKDELDAFQKAETDLARLRKLIQASVEEDEA